MNTQKPNVRTSSIRTSSVRTSSFFLFPSSFSHLPSSFPHFPSSFFLLPSSFSPAFTLVELLVVIAIIGILAGVLLSTFSGGSESARAARCLSNLKNLAVACQTYGMQNGRYPNAGSIEYMKVDESQGRKRAKMTYHERPGWISWDSRNGYPSDSHRSNPTVGLYSEDEDATMYALTNGCLWKLVSRNRQTYVCPSHAKKATSGGRAVWSYVMNGFFGWDTTKGSGSYTEDGNYITYGSRTRADRFLLFAEVPFMGYSSWQPEGAGGSEDTDPVLQYPTGDLSGEGVPSSPGNETIGANHVQGKNLFAHVAFADGHVEKLRIPFTGSVKNPQADESQLTSLTSWLCGGRDIAFDGKKYQKMTND